MTEPEPLDKALLDQLEAHWQRRDAPIASQLAAGLSDSEIDALTEPLGLKAPPEARTWWKWHNGAQDAFIVRTGGKAYSSLETCVGKAEQMRAIARDVTRPYRLSASEADEMARSVWNWNWLPVSEDGAGSMLVIDAAADKEPRRISPVWYRAIDDGSQAALAAPSLGALVRRWITVLESSQHREQSRLEIVHLPAGYDDRLL